MNEYLKLPRRKFIRFAEKNCCLQEVMSGFYLFLCDASHHCTLFLLCKAAIQKKRRLLGLVLGRQQQLSVQIITESLAVAMHNPLSCGPFCVVNHMARGPLGPP